MLDMFLWNLDKMDSAPETWSCWCCLHFCGIEKFGVTTLIKVGDGYFYKCRICSFQRNFPIYVRLPSKLSSSNLSFNADTPVRNHSATLYIPLNIRFVVLNPISHLFMINDRSVFISVLTGFGKFPGLHNVFMIWFMIFLSLRNFKVFKKLPY